MSAAKKAATVKKAKRPPRKVWTVADFDGDCFGMFATKKEAKRNVLPGDTVVGPYVLAERVATK